MFSFIDKKINTKEIGSIFSLILDNCIPWAAEMRPNFPKQEMNFSYGIGIAYRETVALKEFLSPAWFLEKVNGRILEHYMCFTTCCYNYEKEYISGKYVKKSKLTEA